MIFLVRDNLSGCERTVTVLKVGIGYIYLIDSALLVSIGRFDLYIVALLVRNHLII